MKKHFKTQLIKKNLINEVEPQEKKRLLVSGRSPESSDCFLTFMEQ